MKHIVFFTVLIFSAIACKPKEKTDIQITLSSLTVQDKPNPVIVLTNIEVENEREPVLENEKYLDEAKWCYQIEVNDLEKIKECDVLRQGNVLPNPSLLIEITANNKYYLYALDRVNGSVFLNRVDKIIAKYYTKGDLKYNLERLILAVEKFTPMVYNKTYSPPKAN